jgi:hypothetical protein
VSVDVELGGHAQHELACNCGGAKLSAGELMKVAGGTKRAVLSTMLVTIGEP